MKKFLCILLVCLSLCGCSSLKNKNIVNTNTRTNIVGTWISYSELDTMLLSGDFKRQFSIAVDNCKARGITDVFVHTRPYCDAFYNSQLFPKRESAATYDFDILEYMIIECHNNGIKFHAWINPYRVRTADSDVKNLPDDSIVRKWCGNDKQTNDNNVCFLNNGIYLNPASSKVQQLVIDGIREIINGYEVDGIHFDDYFYPTVEDSFDSVSYAQYCQNTQTPLVLDDWRRANVNALISGSYTAIKFKDKDIVFSVSPSASTSENYNRHYADVSAWCKSGCIDYIIPQLYFGFEYPDSNYRFENLINDWQKLVGTTETKLLIGLASYKINTQNEPDKTEWQNGTDVIKKQMQICKTNTNISGYIYFSYTSMCEFL